MVAAVADWLGSVSALVFRVAAVLFVLVNGAAIAAVALTRDRALVNRLTPPWLATNALLLGAGLGVPLVAGIARAGLLALAAMAGGLEVTPSE